jgi:hypothetical protein
MAFLSQAPRLEGLLPSHGAFQGHATHLLGWSMKLSPKGSRGVGRIRARSLMARLPNPPVRPVRETFASYGSREKEIMGKVHFASSTEPSPWTAWRVRWVPLYCFPPRPLRPCAVYVACLRSDSYGLLDCLEDFGVSLGSRLPTLHPPSHPLQALPCSQHRTQSGMLSVACCSLPLPLSVASQTLQGVDQVYPWHLQQS